MDDQAFDRFWYDATYNVAELWEEAGGERLTADELFELNDLLKAYFGAKRLDRRSRPRTEGVPPSA